MSNEKNAPTLSFQEFLRSKADEFGVGDRRRRRKEWLETLHQFYDQLRDWLRQSDPDGLLEIELYEVSRTEPRLGTYDAPALQIRLGTEKVDILPIAREVPNSPSIGRAFSTAAWQGRVDVTDGFKRYYLFREASDGADRWRIRDENDQYTDLDPASFERILQDLLS